MHTAQDVGGITVPTPRASSCAAPAGALASSLAAPASEIQLQVGGAGLVAWDETWRVTVDGNVASWELLKPKGEVPHARVAASLCPLPSGGFLLQGGAKLLSPRTTFGATSVLEI